MYGREKLNVHSMLKYGWTKDFFEQFASLTHLGIEIAPTLVRYLHVFIREMVDERLKVVPFAKQLAKKHHFVTMKDVQHALARSPSLTRDLSKVAHRQAICMPGRLVSLAVDRFPKHEVILLISTVHDQEEVAKVKLPRTFKPFQFHAAVNRHNLSERRKQKIESVFDACILQSGNHVVFSQPKFKTYMKRHVVRAAQAIEVLERLIRKQPIGIILDHVEIINPGTTMGMLARKFNLPFVNMPQVLIADRTLIPTRATHHFVWGEHYRDWLLRRGINEEQIYMTGNVTFEYAQKEHSREAKRYPSLNLNIPQHHLILVFTSQPFVRTVNKKVLSWIQHTVDEKLPVTILIKPHPKDPMSYEQASRLPNVHVVSPNISIYHIIDQSHFLMTISSTTSIEAAMRGKGIIHLDVRIPYHFDHHNNGFNSHLKEAEAGASVNSAEQFKQIVQRLLNDENYRSHVIQNGQLFLRKTLKTNPPPSIATARLIKRLLPRPKE